MNVRLVTLVAVLALPLFGGGRSLAADPHEGHEHGSDDRCLKEPTAAAHDNQGPTDEHAGHEHGPSVFAMNDEQRRAPRCEHGVATIDCTSCSHEVGVIHVDPALLGTTDGHPPLIVVGTTATVAVDDTVETYGHVALDEERAAHVSPRVSGAIKEVHRELGDDVQAGDPLFELCSVQVGQAAAAYLKARALTRLAKRELDRARQLLQQRVTSEKEVFRLEYEFEQAVIERDAAGRHLTTLGVPAKELESIETNEALLEGRYAVRSPIAGTIVEKHAVTGEFVEPGTSVMLVADLAIVWVWAQIYDRDAGSVLEHGREPGKEAAVRIDAFPDRTFIGVVDHVSPIVESDTRTVKVRVIVDNESRLLLPGMFCRVHLPLHTHEVLAVPRDAVLDDGATRFVFVPYGTNRFAVRAVRAGTPHGDSLPVLAGLSPGEPIVTHGTFMLKSEFLKERMGAG